MGTDRANKKRDMYSVIIKELCRVLRFHIEFVYTVDSRAVVLRYGK